MYQFLFFQAPPPGGMGGNGLLFFVGAMFLVMYFFMIRPQQKKAKQAKQFQDNISKGDKVITIAGIHGTINRVNEDGTLQLEISPGTYMKMERSAVNVEMTQALNKPVAATVPEKEKVK
jgi:preprotein translocase subunit YajC